MPDAPQRFSPFARQPAQVAKPEARASSSERGYTWQWTKFRERMLAKHPTCEHCWKFDGRSTPTDDIDHVIPHVGKLDRLLFDEADCRGLCHRHHARKTRRFDKRTRAYFDKLMRDGVAFERARDLAVERFRFAA